MGCLTQLHVSQCLRSADLLDAHAVNMAAASKRSVNFAAGPAKLALPVLEEAATAMTNYKGVGVGVMELSHR